MSWTTPATLTTNTLMTAALWNQQIKANLDCLGTHAHTGVAGDGPALYSPETLMIGMFQTDCPAGWDQVWQIDNMVIRANAAVNFASTDTHTHLNPTHVHTGTHTHAVGTFSQSGFTAEKASRDGGATAVSADHHYHYISGTSGVVQEGDYGNLIQDASTLPPYINVVFCRKA